MKNEAIENWLEQFKKFWSQKDVNGIATLFSQDVEYWETPFQPLQGIDAVVNEWQSVNTQEDINIQTDLVCMDADRATVKWDLLYTKDSHPYTWSGLYLLNLNDEGRCKYFFQVGEEKK